jgi:hypothetical protein
MQTLTKLLQIEMALTKLECSVPFGLRKATGLSEAMENVSQLIEFHLECETLKGVTDIPPSYADAEEIEREYAKMKKALSGDKDANEIKTQ